MLDYWVCLTCRSVNRPNASKCYSCRAAKGAPPAPPEAPQAVVQAAPVPPPPRPFAAPVEAAAPPASAAIPSVTRAPQADLPRATDRDPAPKSPQREESGRPVAPVVAAAPAIHRRAAIRRSLRRGLLAGIVVAALAVLVGGGVVLVRRGANAPPTRPTLTGRLDLNQAKGSRAPTYVELKGSEGACTGTGDYADVRIGMPITVEADGGRLIGQAWLAAGQVTTDGEEQACSFAFSVPGLAEAPGYRINAGDLESIDVTPEELQAAGWKVTITIGP